MITFNVFKNKKKHFFSNQKNKGLIRGAPYLEYPSRFLKKKKRTLLYQNT